MIGTWDITTRRETGVFFCPACVNQCTFHRRVVRRFLTFYYIPLIPLYIQSDTLTCQTCKKAFRPDVVHFDPEAYRREFNSHLLRTMVLLLASEQHVKEPQLAEIQKVYRALTRQDLSSRALADELSLARQHNTLSAVEYVRRIGLRLGEPAKDQLVQACFLAVTAAGDLSQNLQKQLSQFPAALGMSDARFRKVIEQVLQNA